MMGMREEAHSVEAPLVLFDFDGTLADSVPLIVDILRGYAPRYGLPNPDDGMLRRWRKMGVRDFKAEYHLGWPTIGKIVWELRRDLKARMGEIAPVAGMAEALRMLGTGAELGVVSSTDPALLKTWLAVHLPDVSFGQVHGGISLLGKAPVLRAARRAAGGRPVLFVGDELRDMEAAKAAGVTAVAVGWGLNDPSVLRTEADVFLETARGIGDLIRRA